MWLPGQPDGAAQTGWAREFFAAVRPYQSGAYMNFLDRDDDAQIAEAFDEANHRRLMALKHRYDPDNVFQHGHTIPLSSDGRGPDAPSGSEDSGSLLKRA